MLDLNDKIKILEKYLSNVKDNYADSFKTDILFYIEDFDGENLKLEFLNGLNSEKEIFQWVDKLTSKIVMKFDDNQEQLSDFIYYAAYEINQKHFTTQRRRIGNN